MAPPLTILITGGTGLIGRKLTSMALSRGYHVIILTQQHSLPTPHHPNLKYANWHVKKQQIDEQAILEADIIIHLAGAGVAEKRWTKQYKTEIAESRIQGGELLTNTLKQLPHRVKVFVSASAIGWYGPSKTTQSDFEENAPAYTDFLGMTCKSWEASIQPVSRLNIRLCIVRTGIVLSTEGGALKEFLRPVKMGIVPVLGSGHQVISWIHLEDLCEIYFYLINNNQYEGVFNAVSSNPTTNRQFIKTLADVNKSMIKIPIRIPGWLLHMIMGESSIEVLKSTRVSNKKIKETGFTFLHDDLKIALRHLLSNKV